MRCPSCGGDRHGVTETRVLNRRSILRRRRCLTCGIRFKTMETATQYNARSPRQGLPLGMVMGEERFAKGNRTLTGPGGAVVLMQREQELLEQIGAAWPTPVERRIVWRKVWGRLPIKDSSASWWVSKLGRSLRKAGIQLRVSRRTDLTWYSLDLIK